MKMKLLAITLVGVAMADYVHQKPVGWAPYSETDDKRPDSREGDSDDFPVTRGDSYGAGGAGSHANTDVHHNDERYYRRYGDLANDRYSHEHRTAQIGDMTMEYEIDTNSWKWECQADTYFAQSENVQVVTTAPVGDNEDDNSHGPYKEQYVTAARYCNFDFEACRRVCEEMDECAGFDIRWVPFEDDCYVPPPNDDANDDNDQEEFFGLEPKSTDSEDEFMTNNDNNGNINVLGRKIYKDVGADDTGSMSYNKGLDEDEPDFNDDSLEATMDWFPCINNPTGCSGAQTVCTLKTRDDVIPELRKNTGECVNKSVTCTRSRGRPSKECPEDMVLVPRFTGGCGRRRRLDDESSDDSEDPHDGVGHGWGCYSLDIENVTDGDLCIDWTTPEDFEHWTALIGRSNQKHHNEPIGDGDPPLFPPSGTPIRTPWGVIDTRVRKRISNWPLRSHRLTTWRRTFGQGGRSCRDGNDFTKSDCMASQYAAAVVCERRGLTLCTAEQYQSLFAFEHIFGRDLSCDADANWETSSPRDYQGDCQAESYEKLNNRGESQGCSRQQDEREVFAYKCCEEFRHKHVQVDGYVLQHDHYTPRRVNSTDLMRHNHFDAIEVEYHNGRYLGSMNTACTENDNDGLCGAYYIPEKQFRVHTHYAMDGTRFTHRHYTTFGDGHSHDRRWDILYGGDGEGHAQGHSYNGFEGAQAAGYDFNLGYDARQGYARGDYGEGHVHSNQHGHAHHGHDPDGQNYGPSFYNSHSHAQYDIHGFGHASDLDWEDTAHETHYVAQ